MQAYFLCFHDRELYCKFDSVESGRFGHSSVKSDIAELIFPEAGARISDNSRAGGCGGASAENGNG